MKQQKQKNKSVLDRVDSVLSLHAAQYPNIPLSISSLAKQAKISRSNLYVSHPNIVQRLQSSRPHKIEGLRTVGKKSDSSQEIDDLKRTNAALLLLNIQLRQEILKLERRVHT